MDAAAAVDGKEIGAEDLRQLPRGSPAQQIHLEESVLRVEEAQGAGGVAPARGADRRDAESVEVDADRGCQPGERRLAFEPWQGGGEPVVEPEDRTSRGDAGKGGDDPETDEPLAEEAGDAAGQSLRLP